MIRCEDCGGIFPESEVLFGSRCPDCLGESLEEVEKCAECGFFAHELEEELCPKCAGSTLRLFRDVLHLYFSAPQVDFLSRTDCF